jgi:hypothetical protein
MRRLSVNDAEPPAEIRLFLAQCASASPRPRRRSLVTANTAGTEPRTVSGAADEALSRCATGEVSPETTLTQLLAQIQSEEETETVLGTAIWNALENRDGIRAERLAQVQRLWNRLRRPLHAVLHSL